MAVSSYVVPEADRARNIRLFNSGEEELEA